MEIEVLYALLKNKIPRKLSDIENDLYSPENPIPYECLGFSDEEKVVDEIIGESWEDIESTVMDELNGEVI